MSHLLVLTLGALLAPEAAAFTTDDEVHIGIEPQLIHRFHRERQDALRGGEAWQAFLSAEGMTWQARFDERTGTPLRAWGSPIDIGPTDDADGVTQGLLAFFGKHESLLGVPVTDLAPRSAHHMADTDTWYVEFDRLVGGAPVYRGGVTARVVQGKLVLFGVSTHPGATVKGPAAIDRARALELARAAGPAPEAAHEVEGARLVVLPLERGGAVRYHLAWETRTRTASPPGIWISHVDAHTGALLNVYNEVRFLDGQLLAEHDLRYPDGRTATSPVPLARVESSAGGTNTDVDGRFTLDLGGGFSTELRGSYLRVLNDDGAEGEGAFSSATFTWTDDDATLAEIDTYIFLHQVRDWGLTYAPQVGMVTDGLRSTVNMSSTCNAYYDGTVNFYKAGDGCNNTGRIADVNYHEWGHGLHYTSLVAGSFDGSISEGIGDVTSALLTGDYIIAPYFMTSGSGIREISTDRVYPDDVVGQVHTDGLIFAGAVWDLWGELNEVYPQDEAYDIVSTLFARSLRGGPTIPESYDEFVLADDDDGDLSNGTPNLCLILDAFNRHGLGPSGSDTLLYLGHEALANQPFDAPDHPIDARVTNLAPDCFTSVVGSAKVHYAVDGGDWQVVDLNVEGDDITGAIPAQAPGSVVHYYVEAVDEAGGSLYNPEGGFINPHSFFVGELIALRCDDFEDADGAGYTSELVDGTEELGADDWQLGTPAGNGGDPSFAFSGDNVWGNDLGVGNYNGEYQNEKHNRLTSSAFDVREAGGRQLVLQFRRWLTVEDGYYDQARVLVDGEAQWTNHESSRQIGDEHHVDKQWALHTMLIEDVDGDGEVTLSWDIISDQGLSFGGWNIDDVCVYMVGDTPEVDPGDDTGDVGGPTDTGDIEDLTLKAGCGCAAGGGRSSGGLWLGLLALGLAWTSRRR